MTIRQMVEKLVESAAGNLDKEVKCIATVEVAVQDDWKPYAVSSEEFNITSNHPGVTYITVVFS